MLLVGPSMVGKTRIAATLIKEMLPTRDLLIPDSKDALVSLGAPAATLRTAVPRSFYGFESRFVAGVAM